MMKCKRCMKSKSELDANGFCEKCAKRAGIGGARQISFEKVDPNRSVPKKSSGAILSKSEWAIIKSSVDKYMNSVSDDDIEEYNNEVIEVKRNRIRESKERGPAKKGYIYLLRSSVGLHKIGRTTRIEGRLNEHRRNYPIKIEMIFCVSVDDCVLCESFLLRRFRDKHRQGEWFELSTEDVDWICSLTGDALSDMSELTDIIE